MVNNLVYSKTLERLTWGQVYYRAVTGGFGKGPLPDGEYKVMIRNVVVDAVGSGFKDSMTGKSWFIPLRPVFATARSGFGIHPDGSPKGTKGCIGLQGHDAESFWKRWNNTPMSQRPQGLTVSSNT